MYHGETLTETYSISFIELIGFSLRYGMIEIMMPAYGMHKMDILM